MSSPIDDARTVVGISVTRTSTRPKLIRRVLSCWRAIWIEVVESTPAGVLS